MHQYLVEFLGTLFLVSVILATGNWLAIGGALAVAVFLGKPISGGAFNPAVTGAMFMAGKLSEIEVAWYTASQLLGGIAAYYLYTKFLRKL